MKTIILLTLLCFTTITFGQKKKKFDLNLTNAIVVGQTDNGADRYSIEVNLTEILNSNGVLAIPALNVAKTGADAKILASDSMKAVLAAKGIDTYVLVTVRGYDRRFKPAETQVDLSSELQRANLFQLYQMDLVSVSFELKFYRNDECVYSEIIRIGSIGSRESVIKKFRKKVNKLLKKRWK